MKCASSDQLEALAVTGKTTRFLILHHQHLEYINDRILDLTYNHDTDQVIFANKGKMDAVQIIMADGKFIHNPFEEACTKLRSELRGIERFGNILSPAPEKWIKADLSKYNPMAMNGQYINYLNELCGDVAINYAWGGYGEPRPVYDQHALFRGTNPAASTLALTFGRLPKQMYMHPWPEPYTALPTMPEREITDQLSFWNINYMI
jgi:hypothetical protein